jgi:uncharacterized protein
MIPAAAAPAFPCAGPGREEFEAVCADPELVQLDRAADTALARRLAGADPLTAMLLKRDQRWFNDILGGQNIGPFERPDDPERARMLTALQSRPAALERLRVTGVEGLPGEWTNAFSTAKVTQRSDGMLAVEVIANVTYGDRDEPVTCGATAQAKPAGDGWFAGPATRTTGDDASDEKDSTASTNSPFQLRVRLQGNTLRIVLTPSEQDTICGVPEQITGSYFAVGSRAAGRMPPAGPAARTVSPSFPCATAKTADEEEICADPELAARDIEIARAYRETLRRLDAKTAGYLRADQRAYLKENAIAVDVRLHPAWDKQTYFVHHTGDAREELRLRLAERLAMLTNLDETRRGPQGRWVGHDALLIIEPAKDKPAGTMHASGGKWDSADYKSNCSFEEDGRIVGGVFKPAGPDFPKLARDGATLTIDGDDPDPILDRNGEPRREQPGYCTRMRSAKARLFPVKPNAAIDVSDGRIR